VDAELDALAIASASAKRYQEFVTALEQWEQSRSLAAHQELVRKQIASIDALNLYLKELRTRRFSTGSEHSFAG
jgi:DNA repair ATPase RecN